jgi:hypothetical protein
VVSFVVVVVERTNLEVEEDIAFDLRRKMKDPFAFVAECQMLQASNSCSLVVDLLKLAISFLPNLVLVLARSCYCSIVNFFTAFFSDDVVP